MPGRTTTLSLAPEVDMRSTLDRRPARRMRTRALACTLAWTAVLAAAGCDEDGGITLGLPVANQLEVVSGSGQSVPAGSAAGDPFVVRVVDQADNPMSGAAVTFAIDTGGGSLSATQATSDASGLASTTYTAGSTTGPARVSATAAGLRAVTFTATITPALPATPVLTILGGNAQTVTAGAAVAIPLTVRLATTTGTPVVGATVTFAIGAGGGSLSSATARTDASGNASTTYTAGTTAGPATITASAAGAPPVVFTATIAAAAGG